MIRSGNFASSFVLGAFLLVPVTVSSVAGDEYVYGGVQQIADRCARLGNGFVDVGNGLCGRVSGHIRVGGTSNTAMNGWASNGTSNAAMRSSGPSMVPGAEVTQRLRVRGNLDSASPFR